MHPRITKHVDLIKRGMFFPPKCWFISNFSESLGLLLEFSSFSGLNRRMEQITWRSNTFSKNPGLTKEYQPEICAMLQWCWVGSLAKPNPNQLLVSQEVWWKCGLDCLKYLIPRKVPHNGCLLALFWGLKLCWLWFSYSIAWYFDLSVDGSSPVTFLSYHCSIPFVSSPMVQKNDSAPQSGP